MREMADDTGTDDTGTENESEEDEYEPPDQATWSQTTAALTKANNEAKKWRLRAQGKDEKWSVPGFVKEAPTEDDTEEDKPAARKRTPKVDVDAVKRETEEAAMARLKPGLVRSEAKDALRAAGLILPEKNADAAYQRAIRLFDMDAIELDEDGTVSGVDDQVKAVKRDYPELFARKSARAVNAGAGSNGDGAGEKKDTSANRLAAMLGGG